MSSICRSYGVCMLRPPGMADCGLLPRNPPLAPPPPADSADGEPAVGLRWCESSRHCSRRPMRDWRSWRRFSCSAATCSDFFFALSASCVSACAACARSAALSVSALALAAPSLSSLSSLSARVARSFASFSASLVASSSSLEVLRSKERSRSCSLADLRSMCACFIWRWRRWRAPPPGSSESAPVLPPPPLPLPLPPGVGGREPGLGPRSNLSTRLSCRTDIDRTVFASTSKSFLMRSTFSHSSLSCSFSWASVCFRPASCVCSSSSARLLFSTSRL
mmetsp:Transcript_28183/g.92028  ORF Transcript_28183/g.92028 Transcript_28183/m.92028 type:complete len:278 (-) Transcript_28183:1272-2105(-)